MGLIVYKTKILSFKPIFKINGDFFSLIFCQIREPMKCERDAI